MTEDKKLADYDPESFTVPASDSKGHQSDKIWFKCPPALAQQVGIIIESKKFPYQTASGLHRHALLLHLRWLETLAPVPSVLSQAEFPTI